MLKKYLISLALIIALGLGIGQHIALASSTQPDTLTATFVTPDGELPEGLLAGPVAIFIKTGSRCTGTS